MMGQLNADEIETLIHKCLIGRIGCSDGKLTYSESLRQLPGVTFRIHLTSKTGRFERGD
jgi:hypothetical protein